jgi:hypothetical protein
VVATSRNPMEESRKKYQFIYILFIIKLYYPIPNGNFEFSHYDASLTDKKAEL